MEGVFGRNKRKETGGRRARVFIASTSEIKRLMKSKSESK